MKRNGTASLSAIAVFLLCGALTQVRAGIISSASTVALPGSSTATIGPIGNNPAPNNDNDTTASPNLIPYTIFYNALGVGIADVEFIVSASGGTTEYRNTQTLINNTGETWTGFHFELGFGLGSGFVRSGPADFLDFDTPDLDPAATASVFTQLSHQADTVDWTGGTVPSIGVAAFSLAIDVPDNLTNFHPGGLNRFTLRQVPITAVPEPGSLLLAGIGAICLLVRQPRKLVGSAARIG